MQQQCTACCDGNIPTPSTNRGCMQHGALFKAVLASNCVQKDSSYDRAITVLAQGIP